MKKIFTVITLLLSALSISAQALVFTDAEGNEIPNGSTLTMDKIEDDEFGKLMIPLEGVNIKNTAESDAKFKLLVNIEEMNNGMFQCCYGSVCRACEVGLTEINDLSIKGGTSQLLKDTEWIVDEGKYDALKVKFAIEKTGFGGGKQTEITVNFVYSDPTRVANVSNTEAQVVRRMDATGRETNSNHGLLIEKLSDGSVRKVIR